MKIISAIRGCWLGIFLCQSSVVCALDTKQLAPIVVIDAVVYVPLGKSQTTQAFFVIKNNSANDISITGASSAQIKKIELVPAPPKSATDANPWQISAHQTLSLKADKQYLRLSGLKNSLTTGDELQLEVTLSNGKKLLVIAKAKSAFDQLHGQ